MPVLDAGKPFPAPRSRAARLPQVDPCRSRTMRRRRCGVATTASWFVIIVCLSVADRNR